MNNSKIEQIQKEADRLIAEGGRAISWHIREGLTGISTAQVNYYMRKLVAAGLYTAKRNRNYCIEYKQTNNK